MMRKIITILFGLIAFISATYSQYNTDSLKIITTRAKDTDLGMTIEFSKHYSFYNPTCVSKNTLITPSCHK